MMREGGFRSRGRRTGGGERGIVGDLLVKINILAKNRKDRALRIMSYSGMGPMIDDGTRVVRSRRELLNGSNAGGQVDKTEVGKGTLVPIMKIADAEGWARLAQATHPNPNKGIVAPRTDLLNPKEGSAKLVAAGFPLNTVGLMHSMFAQFDDACGTAKKGGDPLRGEVNDDITRRRNSGRRGRVNRLCPSASKVPGARADQSNSSRQAGQPMLARFRG